MRKRRYLGIIAGLTLAAAFTAGAAAEPISLAGSEWGFKDETGDHQRSVQFDGDGVVSGSGGCNRFSGHYEQNGDTLKISDLRVTLMACNGDGVMQREAAFLGALSKSERIELTHLVLKTFDAVGAPQLELVRRDFD